MRYKTTMQYSSDSERPLAEFMHLNDSMLFINSKSSTDDAQGVKLIYRLYDHDSLLQEFNKEKISGLIARAQYARGDTDLPYVFAQPFCVNVKDQTEKPLGKFCKLEDVQLFIEAKKGTETGEFLIYNGNELIETISAGASAAQGSQGQTSEAAFRPTPLAIAPRLGPSNWIVNKDDDKKE